MNYPLDPPPTPPRLHVDELFAEQEQFRQFCEQHNLPIDFGGCTMKARVSFVEHDTCELINETWSESDFHIGDRIEVSDMESGEKKKVVVVALERGAASVVCRVRETKKLREVAQEFDLEPTQCQ